MLWELSTDVDEDKQAEIRAAAIGADRIERNFEKTASSTSPTEVTARMDTITAQVNSVLALKRWGEAAPSIRCPRETPAATHADSLQSAVR
jgi:hypothetical protein